MVPKATTLDEETGPELPIADSELVTHTNIQTDSIETETHRRNGYRAIRTSRWTTVRRVGDRRLYIVACYGFTASRDLFSFRG